MRCWRRFAPQPGHHWDQAGTQNGPSVTARMKRALCNPSGGCRTQLINLKALDWGRIGKRCRRSCNSSRNTPKAIQICPSHGRMRSNTTHPWIRHIFNGEEGDAEGHSDGGEGENEQNHQVPRFFGLIRRKENETARLHSLASVGGILNLVEGEDLRTAGLLRFSIHLVSCGCDRCCLADAAPFGHHANTRSSPKLGDLGCWLAFRPNRLDLATRMHWRFLLESTLRSATRQVEARPPYPFWAQGGRPSRHTCSKDHAVALVHLRVATLWHTQVMPTRTAISSPSPLCQLRLRNCHNPRQAGTPQVHRIAATYCPRVVCPPCCGGVKPNVMAAAAATAGRAEEFHVRYYVGNKGRFGHEFLELEVSLPGKPGSPGRLRYANSPGAKRGPILRKEVLINPLVVKEIQKIVFESKILQCNDDKWPEPNELGKQEIEIVTPSDHVCFAVSLHS